MHSQEPVIAWRRTFQECEPGTDGVAIADGSVIGWVRSTSKLWLWSVTDPELAGQPGWSNTHGEVTSREKRWQAWSRVGGRYGHRSPPLTPSHSGFLLRPVDSLKGSQLRLRGIAVMPPGSAGPVACARHVRARKVAGSFEMEAPATRPEPAQASATRLATD